MSFKCTVISLLLSCLCSLWGVFGRTGPHLCGLHFSNDNEANVIFGSVLKTCSAFKRDRNCD